MDPTEDILQNWLLQHDYCLLKLYKLSAKFLHRGVDFTLTIHTLDIRNNSQLNGLNVPDASWIPVSSTQDVLDLMKIGQRNRAVGATALNERSSRSHRYEHIFLAEFKIHSSSIHCNGSFLLQCFDSSCLWKRISFWINS